jgi:anti-sigma factor RsiW
MGVFGGHLGSAVSALVDGQLDEESSERAWAHVLACSECRVLVEREGWLKRRLGQMDGAEPPAHLVGSLRGLYAGTDPDDVHQSLRPSPEGLTAWVRVDELEHTGGNRRLTGLALAGVGTVSVAVFGLATLGGLPFPTGGVPAGPPASLLTRATATGSPGGAIAGRRGGRTGPVTSNGTGTSSGAGFGAGETSAVSVTTAPPVPMESVLAPLPPCPALSTAGGPRHRNHLC